jgi:hypothetical protein
MLAFRDFAPAVLRQAGFLQPAQYDSFEHAVEEAGVWIEQEGIDVVSIETVVLPNIHRPHEEGTTDPDVAVSMDAWTNWNQFVRVWYRA